MRRATTKEMEIYRGLQANIIRNNRRNVELDAYAEAEKLIDYLDYTLPNGRQVEQTPLHWPQKAIEVFASRLSPRGFSMEGNPEVQTLLDDVWAEGSIEFAEALAIESSLRHGVSFMFVGRGDPDAGDPAIVATAASARTASAEIDPRTRRVTSALEMTGRRMANLYLHDRVLEVELLASGSLLVREEYDVFGVPCAPYIHGATLNKPFGQSRISKPLRGFTRAAMRTFMRQEVSADWYSYPRERLLGADKSVFEELGWDQAPGRIQGLPDIHPDDEPDIPDELRRAQLVTAPQMSMQPFSDQFRLIASQFSGTSSIPLQYLGIISDSNPTSSKAIEAQDIDLVRAVRSEWSNYNYGRLRLARAVLELQEEVEIDPWDLRKLRSRWADPRVRGLLEQGQFVAQQVQVGNFQAGTQDTLDLLPIEEDEARAHAVANRGQESLRTLNALLGLSDDEDEETTTPGVSFDQLSTNVAEGA